MPLHLQDGGSHVQNEERQEQNPVPAFKAACRISSHGIDGGSGEKSGRRQNKRFSVDPAGADGDGHRGDQAGIAYDGDGDRCLCVDENGRLIDGDAILAITSNYLKEKGQLKGNTVVATVMSNLGLRKYCQENGLNFVATSVGDRYVLENMLENGYNLGGEQSGHVIYLDYNPTGDGILTSLMLVQILLEKKMKASEAAKIITIFPQVLINAKVPSDKKLAYKDDAEIMAMIESIEKEFEGNGRVLIRPSGTEPLVRVMIEGENQEILNDRARALADLIEKKMN